MWNCFNIVEITKFLILVLCHGNHGGIKGRGCHLPSLHMILSKRERCFLQSWKLNLHREALKAKIKTFQRFQACSIRFRMMECLPKKSHAVLFANQEGHRGHRDGTKEGWADFFSRLLRQPSSNPLTLISEQQLEYLMWKIFFLGMGLSSPLQTQDKCNWLVFPFLSPHNLFFWFLA